MNLDTQVALPLLDQRCEGEGGGWQRLLESEFRTLVELSAEERRQVVILPPSIAKLTAQLVKRRWDGRLMLWAPTGSRTSTARNVPRPAAGRAATREDCSVTAAVALQKFLGKQPGHADVQAAR
ncbi:hypothetical protein ACIHCQ_44515 [Streptomyces sp. NPDC052236]|uniref:hypothetical protein n=1 Tax=Streptomyces sp. NPDC052236 TaxID=3365686 RepID=UPI0037D453FB